MKTQDICPNCGEHIGQLCHCQKTKHRPGPWELGRKARNLSSYTVVIGAFTIYAPNKPTARLIAAAPEMLAMLLDNLAAWEGEEDSVRSEHKALIAELKMVIKRAEG